MDQRELTREERAAIRALVVKWCANYDWDVGCLPLDCEDLIMSIADMFSKMDTGSKSGLIHSYSSTLAQARALVQQYCNQYNFPTSHVGLAGATAGIDKFFQAWINKL